jgi:hypothetical protein
MERGRVAGMHGNVSWRFGFADGSRRRVRWNSASWGSLFAFAFLFLALFGCGDDGNHEINEPEPPIPPCGRLLVLTSDFQTGSVSVVDADSSFAARLDVAEIHPDAVARVHDGLVYVVNRFGGDNIQVLDPADGYRTVRQFSVGAGSNPHDIAFASSDHAYVSRNGSTSLLVIDPRDGSQRGEISLASFADPDGIPDMDRLLFKAPYLYVAIARIDFGGMTYKPVPPSYLAVVDTRADTLADMDPETEGVQGIVLQGLNPSSPIVWDRGRFVLLVPEVGDYGVLDGGIEKVDPATGMSTGFLTREQDLGGDLLDFAIPENGPGYATISVGSMPNLVTSLVAFDQASGERIATVHQSAGFDLSDLVITPCNRLVVCDRDYGAPGLRVFVGSSGLPWLGVTQPVPTGLPPFELVLLGE